MWKTIDRTSSVRDWHEGNYENPGVVLWATNEDVDSYDLRMYSWDYSDIDYLPYLEVTYTPQAFAKHYYLKDHPAFPG